MLRARPALLLMLPAVLLAAGVALAGPLNPPPGPVAPTQKTLTEVEPRIAVSTANTPGSGTSIHRITQPGSYYLASNISGGAGRHGIEIAASGVSLDLNGFELVGVPGSLDGVTVVGAGLSNIAVINGSVRSWGGDGVDLATSLAINSRVERVHASSNGGSGILTTSGSTVSHSSASFNILAGIHAGNGGSIANCSATGNGTFGISTLGGGSVTNSAVYQNTGNGINVGTCSTVADCASFDNGGHGISAGTGGAISGCTVTSNSGTGIVTSSHSVITFSAASANAVGGIAAGGNASIADCSASNNTGTGISAGAGSTLANCSAGSNSLAGFSMSTSCSLTNCSAYINQGDGILTSQGNTITDCSSFNNLGHGISVATGCTVLDNSVKFNTLDGIRFSSECLVRGNTVSYAGSLAGDGAAIHATGQLNRIEGNHCSRSDRGIDVDLAGNVIVRNTCSANTVNFTFVADNIYGPILDRSTAVTAAVNGSVAASTLGSTDANANYAH